MQQFTVPQFIDVEDKIIGPITVRQFLIMLACMLLSAVAYKLSDFALFVTEALLFFALGGIVAFLRINGRPFHYFILNVIQTLKKPKLRVWNSQAGKEKYKPEAEIEIKQVVKAQPKPLYARSRLAEAALIVDTGGVYQGGDQNIEVRS
ncbi:MAG: PrgI family protein [Patescibacteria group bacterium]